MKTKKIFCPHCNEVITYTAILRRELSGKGIEQPVSPIYCPLCGTKLIPFPGYKKGTLEYNV